MKHLLYICIIFGVTLLFGCKQQNTQDNHTHVHSENCSHAHEHEGHNHDAHTHGHDVPHEHSAECTHDHAHHNEAESHATHNHTHSAECNHSHEGHNHAHEADLHASHNHNHETDVHGEADEHSDEINFPDAQAARTDFEIQEVKKCAFGAIIPCSGDISEAQSNRTAIVSPIDGRVTFASTLTEGSSVKQGDILFYIDTKSLASGDAAVKAKAEYERAKAEYERAKTLYDQRIVSQKDFETAEAEYLRAEAEYLPIASGDEKGIAVKAAKSGYIVGLAIANGDYVASGAVLTTLVDNRRMQLVVEVPQRYYKQLQNVVSANFSIDGTETYSLAELKGRKLSIGRATAAGSAMTTVTFEFDNPGNLISGMYVEVALQCRADKEYIALPVTAITEAQGVHYVYVQVHPETYQRREVKLGGNDGRRVVITEGLHEGEHVVTRGAVQVKMAAASGSIPHGHSHNH